jgi:hypothetical protein
MKYKKLAVLLAAALCLLPAISAFGQDTFSDPNAEYTFSIPDDKWKVTGKPTATLSNMDMVWGDRSEGFMELRKLTVPKDQTLVQLMHGSEENKYSFLRGFVAGKDETFSGKLRGSVFNYEYVAAGKAMAGRNYYLRANDTTVYLIKFSGPKDNIRTLRNQADIMARTFGVK